LKTNKIIAASLSLAVSVPALAGLGGLNVQSNLGEPFSGSIVISGREAEAVMQSRNISISGANLQGTVVPQGNGNVLLHLHSSSAVHEPILTFTVSAGKQTRQYTAMVNPPRYTPAKASAPKASKAPRKSGTLTPIADPASGDALQQERVLRPEGAGERERQGASAKSRYHRVQRGESVASIARRYRPHSISQRRAIQALMAANPGVFRRGRVDEIHRNANLYIPSASQWQAYAAAADRRAARAAARSDWSRQTDNQAGRNDEVKNDVAVPREQVKPQDTVKQQEQPKPEAVKPEPVKPEPAKPEAVKPEAVKPEPAKPEQAKQPEEPMPPVQPPQPETPPASAGNVPAGQQASEGTIAIPPEIQGAASEAPMQNPDPELVPPPAEQDVAGQDGVAGEEVDWTKWAAMGAAGALVLGGSAYLFNNRRRRKEKADNEEDDLPTASEAANRVKWNSAAAQNAAAQAAVQTAADDEADFEDDDEVYIAESITPAAQPQVQPQAQPQASTFDLDSFQPETHSAAPEAVVEENRPEELARAASQSATEFDAGDWNWEEVEAAPATQAAAKPAASAAAVAPAPASEEQDDWMADFDFIQPDEPESMQPETSFSLGEQEVQFAEPAAVEPAAFEQPVFEQPAAVAEPVFEQPAFEQPAVADFAPVGEPEPQPAVTQATDDFGALDFAADFESPQQTVADIESALAEPALQSDAALDFALDMPAVAETADLNVPAAPVADLSVADLSFDDGLDFAQVEQAQQREIAAADPFAAPFASEAEGLSADALAEFTAPAAEVPNYQTHDAIASAEVSDMDTPLEAKLELAKMYLEIDDAATARETLRELIAESNGSSIQDQAKALLAELGN
jgi:fimV C-terminal domain